MPNDADAPADYLTPFAAFPCLLIDRVMPTLKDTEWRLLCVVVRQTVGWKASGHRHKRRDWMTQSQLITRTGRNSAAISTALDGLVRRRLVNATDEAGNLLLTPQQRRRYRGRLYFGLCFEGLETLNPSTIANAKSEEPNKKSKVANANTTIARKDNKLPDGKTNRFHPSQYINSPHDPESQTLNSAKPNGPSTGPVSLSSTGFSGVEHVSEVHRFLHAYRERFQHLTPNGEPPVIDWGKDGRLVKQLLRLYSYPRLMELLDGFFTSPGEWKRKQGYSLYAFKASIGRLLMSETKAAAALRQAIENPVNIHMPGWSRAGDLRSREAY